MKNKSLFTNSIFLAGYKALAILFPLVTSMYVSRVLSAGGVGKVAFAQNIVSYFVVFATLGIPTYGTREIAKVGKNTEKCNQVFSELFTINFISTAVCLFAYYVVVFSFESFKNELLLYSIVSLSLILNIFNVDWFYQGKEEYVYITVRSFIVKVVSLVFLFLFVRQADDYPIYALITCTATALNNVFNVIHLRKYVKFTFRKLNVTKHIKFILVLFSTSLAVELYTQLDTTMIGFICGDTEVAYYSYAMKLIRIITSIITAVSTILLPRLSYCYSNHELERFNTLSTKALQVVLIFSVPATLGIFSVANIIIPLMFGNEFMPSVSILMTSAPLVVILAVGNLFGSSILVAVGKEKYLFYSTLIGAITNMIMNSILIPVYGGNGAAAASVVSELIVMLTQRFYSKKEVKISINPKFLASIVCANVGMYVVLVLLDQIQIPEVFLLIIKVVLGGSVYLSLGYILKNETVLWILKQVNNKVLRKS